MFIAEHGHPNIPRYDHFNPTKSIMTGSPCSISRMRWAVKRRNRKDITIYDLNKTTPKATMSTFYDDLRKKSDATDNSKFSQT
jgi:hypothetical protein